VILRRKTKPVAATGAGARGVTAMRYPRIPTGTRREPWNAGVCGAQEGIEA